MYLWIIAAFTAYFIKGLCGFANTLVFTSILSFGAANANISPVELLIGYPTNFILTWKNRKSLDYKVYLPLAALVLAGSIPGTLLLKNADVSNIKVIAILGLFAGMKSSSLLKEKTVRRMMAVLLILSGVSLTLQNM